MVFSSAGLVVSFPASELRPSCIDRSVLRAERLNEHELQGSFNRAVSLIVAASRAYGTQLAFVPRPEMFTHGSLLNWLRAEIGQDCEHLCLSDGFSIKLIPGMHNHFFLYKNCFFRNNFAFRQLKRRVPEYISQFCSQINTAYCLRSWSKRPKLAPVLVQSSNVLIGTQPDSFRFSMGLGEAAQIAALIASSRTSLDISHFDRIAYFATTEAALYEESFVSFLSGFIFRAYFEPSLCVLLRIPTCLTPLASRLQVLVSRLKSAGQRLPAVPASNVFCLDGDLVPSRAEMQGKIDFFAHDTFDFWSFGPEYYSRFRSISVLALESELECETFEELIQSAVGQKPQIHWLEQAKGPTPNSDFANG